MKSYIHGMIERRRARAAYKVLLAMDDHMLADIGMNRFDLQAMSRTRPAPSVARA